MLRKLNVTFFERDILANTVRNCFLQKHHSPMWIRHSKISREKMWNSVCRNDNKRLHFPWYILAFLISDEKILVTRGEGVRERAVGFVQSAVRMYERTYAYFIFICIWMCTATCSRRRSGLSNGVRWSVVPDRHFSIPVGIYHPAHLSRVPSSSHRICVTLRQRALWQRDDEIQQQIFAHQI